MLPSQRAMVMKLSSHQREFLISHCRGMRPFKDEPIENATRSALIRRKLIRYVPDGHSRLGIPDGTVPTNPFGRETICMILAEYADWLVEAIENEADVSDPDRQKALFDALTECAKYWKREERRQEI